MSMYNKFLIRETDRFDPANFPQLQSNLQKIAVHLNREPVGPKVEMLLSFVKDHCINLQQIKDQPALASLISTQSLPTGDIEDLFECSRNNLLFRKDLETYIRSCLFAAQLY